MAAKDSPFSPDDVRQLEEHGITLEDALRQLELLRNPPGHARLVRACTPGDGITTLPESRWPALLEFWKGAAEAGRLARFVPASGAASRMFRTLLAEYESGGAATRRQLEARAAAGEDVAADVLRLLDNLERFAFANPAMLAAARAGRPREVLELLLDERGLGYKDLPKGLILFHRYPDGPRTAFEEHLVETAAQIRDAAGTCRLHLTISPAHRREFEVAAENAPRRFEALLASRWEIEFSEQSPRTDTIAIHPDGTPFRNADGRLLLRPGGHGALIHNLATLAGKAEIVQIKNIDNVVPDHLREPTNLWKKLLVGLFLEIEHQVLEHAAQVDRDAPSATRVDAAWSFVGRTFGIEPPEDPARRLESLRDRLRRPLRVCGVVRNQGEPGGGPFWVRNARGEVSPQIVEASQIDPAAPDQQAIRAAATHFNPVDLVCGLRCPGNTPCDLLRYVDPDTAFVSRKSHLGHDLLALEWPGLWNGAMAGWNTVFVEVPQETFAPVKTVFDLLRPEHQPPPSA